GYVGFQVPAAAGNATYMLPSADGTNGNVLTTNGSGGLSWTMPPVGPWMINGGNTYYPTGNVGIGTSAPASRLDISGPGGQWINLGSTDGTGNAGLKMFYPTGTLKGELFVSSNDTYFDAGNGNKLHLRVNLGIDALVIDTAGNIGIGTTNPTAN